MTKRLGHSRALRRHSCPTAPKCRPQHTTGTREQSDTCRAQRPPLEVGTGIGQALQSGALSLRTIPAKPALRSRSKRRESRNAPRPDFQTRTTGWHWKSEHSVQRSAVPAFPPHILQVHSIRAATTPLARQGCLVWNPRNLYCSLARGSPEGRRIRVDMFCPSQIGPLALHKWRGVSAYGRPAFRSWHEKSSHAGRTDSGRSCGRLRDTVSDCIVREPRLRSGRSCQQGRVRSATCREDPGRDADHEGRAQSAR
jgi:hypothetical protein